ncbi:hypothetical protein HCN44_004182 [Aphidius gifuensis]|uniref:Uncharacterized protein n=1 Tax=Aphidius gifuensis TaxID=684658 RepID=A0A834XWF2_APHGI|nr:hypothetical protein HCN44_004182 [Aphidius gifuensis]
MSLEPEKKKRKTVSIQEKLDALDEIEKKKKTSTEIARQLGVGHSTVCGWKKDEKLLNMQRELIHAVQANNMKRLRQVDNPLVDKATWQWFKEQKKSGAQLSGPIIKSQAIFFWQNLGLSKSFDASDELTANKCLAEILKSITIREAVFWLARSWNMVTTSTITTSWKSLWPEIQTIKSLSETEVPEVDFNNTTDIVKEFQLALKNDDENNVNEKAINTWLNCPTVQNLNECLSPHEIIENLKN